MLANKVTVVDDCPQLFHLLFALRGPAFVIRTSSQLVVENLLVFLDVALQKFEVLVGVFFQFVDSDGQVVVFLEDNSLNIFFFVLETSIQVVVEFIYLPAHLVLQLLEVILQGD